MRTKKGLKNILYSIFSYGILFLLSLILRKFFLQYLNIDFLGIESVLNNLFSLMALVDVGTGSLITYLLYKAFAVNQLDEVAKLMSIYKMMYLIIAGVMSVLSVFVIPLLPFIIHVDGIDFQYLVLVYIIRILIMAGTYCFAYRRLLFQVDQCEYICTNIDTVSNILKYGISFIVIILTNSYIAYLIVQAIAVISTNYYIAHLSYNKYPYASNIKITITDLKERNFFVDMKNVYAIKLAGTIFGSTDSLILSISNGVRAVALLTNYTIIADMLVQTFVVLFRPLQGSIGNFMYSESPLKTMELFRMFDLLAFLIGSVFAICFSLLINPFIALWFGEAYVLSLAIVILISVKLYMGFITHFVSEFRELVGNFKIDRNYIIVGAFLNIVVSILLVKDYGVGGLYVGTILGMMGFWIGRYKVLVKECFKKSIPRYVLQQFLRFIILTIEFSVCYYLCQLFDIGFFSILLRCVICIAIPLTLNILIYCRSRDFLYLLKYSKDVFSILKKRI